MKRLLSIVGMTFIVFFSATKHESWPANVALAVRPIGEEWKIVSYSGRLGLGTDTA